MAKAKERTMTPEHREAISDAKKKAAETVAKRRINTLLINDREDYVESDRFTQATAGSNSAKAYAAHQVAVERITKKINPDGTPMTLPQQIDARVAAGYGTQKSPRDGLSTVDKLRAKLDGVKPDATGDMTDEEIFASLG